MRVRRRAQIERVVVVPAWLVRVALVDSFSGTPPPVVLALRLTKGGHHLALRGPAAHEVPVDIAITQGLKGRPDPTRGGTGAERHGHCQHR